MGLLKPSPVRMLPLDGSVPAAQIKEPVRFIGMPRRRAASSGLALDRMQVEELSVAYGPKLAVDAVSLDHMDARSERPVGM
jgi:hypothetical protein